MQTRIAKFLLTEALNVYWSSVNDRDKELWFTEPGDRRRCSGRI